MTSHRPSTHKHIVIVAGETSGDHHAAHLVREIRRLAPDIRFSGLGGPRMAESGVELYTDLSLLAVVGFVEVLRHYPTFKRVFDRTLENIRSTPTDAVILVDYPGFNLRLARAIKDIPDCDIPIIYYISPQVWAWKENRVQTIRRTVDRMLVLFEFEKTFYAGHDMEVSFVGHPLIDTVTVKTPAQEVRQAAGLSPDRRTIGLLPGSRQREITSLLPVMIDAAVILKQRFSDLQFLLPPAPGITPDLLNDVLRAAGRKHGCSGQELQDRLNLRLTAHPFYDAVNACTFGIVASGTATLETALLRKPMVLVYKTAFLTWLIARWLIRIPYIGLVNIVAEKKVMPECIQFEATGEHIARHVQTMLTDTRYVERIEQELDAVKLKLGAPGASRRAAEEVLRVVHADTPTTS